MRMKLTLGVSFTYKMEQVFGAWPRKVLFCFARIWPDIPLFYLGCNYCEIATVSEPWTNVMYSSNICFMETAFCDI